MPRMNSLSEDSAVTSRRQERRVPMRLLVLGLGVSALLMLVLGALVVLALMRVWGGEVGMVHAALVLTAFFTGVMVLIAAALGWHAGVRLTRQRQVGVEALDPHVHGCSRQSVKSSASSARCPRA